MPFGRQRPPGGRWRFERPVANDHRGQRVAGHAAAIIAHARPDWGQRLASLVSLTTVAVAVAALLVTNEANREQERLTEQGQITDRFTGATLTGAKLAGARVDANTRLPPGTTIPS